MPKVKIPTVVKQLGLSQTLATVAEKRAVQLGLTTPEYIRHLIVADNNPILTRPEHISPQAELENLIDLVNFLKSEKQHPSKGATSGKELIEQLDAV